MEIKLEKCIYCEELVDPDTHQCTGMIEDDNFWSNYDSDIDAQDQREETDLKMIMDNLFKLGG